MTQTLRTPSPIATSPVFTHMPAEHTGLTYGRTSGETIDLFILYARMYETGLMVPSDLVMIVDDHHTPDKAGFAIPFEDAWLLWQYLNSHTVAALIGVEPLAMPDRDVPDIADLETIEHSGEFTLAYHYAIDGYHDHVNFSLQYDYLEMGTHALLLTVFDEQSEAAPAHSLTLSLQEARVLYDFLAYPQVQALFDVCFEMCLVAA